MKSHAEERYTCYDPKSGVSITLACMGDQMGFVFQGIPFQENPPRQPVIVDIGIPLDKSVTQMISDMNYQPLTGSIKPTLEWITAELLRNYLNTFAPDHPAFQSEPAYFQSFYC